MDSVLVGAVDNHGRLDAAEGAQLSDFLHETALPHPEGMFPVVLVPDQPSPCLLLGRGGHGGYLHFRKTEREQGVAVFGGFPGRGHGRSVSTDSVRDTFPVWGGGSRFESFDI